MPISVSEVSLAETVESRLPSDFSSEVTAESLWDGRAEYCRLCAAAVSTGTSVSTIASSILMGTTSTSASSVILDVMCWLSFVISVSPSVEKMSPFASLSPVLWARLLRIMAGVSPLYSALASASVAVYVE